MSKLTLIHKSIYSGSSKLLADSRVPNIVNNQTSQPDFSQRLCWILSQSGAGNLNKKILEKMSAVAYISVEISLGSCWRRDILRVKDQVLITNCNFL